MGGEAIEDDKIEKKTGGRSRTALIFAALLFLYLWGLGDAGLMEPDEGRYAEIPRNMIATNNYVTPRLNGLKYFEKPALGYWMNAASFKLFGENNFAARFPSALLAFSGAVSVWLFANRAYGRVIADWSALVLGTSFLYYSIGRINILDMPLAAFMTFSMTAAWFAVCDEKREGRWLFLFFASIALATLTKGLIGVVLPGGILLCYALLTRNPRLLWRFARFLPGWAIFTAVTIPWFWLVCSRNPDFFYFFFVHEHFLRYTTTLHDRTQPFWFFLPIYAAAFVPWLGFLPGALRDAFRGIRESFTRRGENSPELFLLCWAFFILIFFSASSSKLIPYIVPAMPPLAVLIARAVRLRTRTDGRVPGLPAALFLNAVILLALAAGLLTLRRYFQDPRYDLPLAWRAGRVIALSMILFAALSAIPLKRVWPGRFNRFAPFFMPVAALILIYTIQPIQLVIASRKSSYELCANLRPILGPDDVVINYRDFIQGLQFYLGKRLVLVEYVGELQFGKDAEPDRADRIFMTEEDFEKFVDTPTAGEKILVIENEDGLRLPPFVARGATVASTSHNFTAFRLRR